MSSIRGPQLQVLIEELLQDHRITLEMATFRSSTYYISTPFGAFTPRVLFPATVDEIVPLQDASSVNTEVPAFMQREAYSSESLTDEEEQPQRESMDGVSLPTDYSQRNPTDFAHLVVLTGITPDSRIFGLLRSDCPNVTKGDQILVSAKVFDPGETEEFLEAFLKIEKVRFLTPEDYFLELVFAYESLRNRVSLLERIETGEVGFYRERGNYVMTMYQFAERNLAMKSVQEAKKFVEGIRNLINGQKKA